MMDKIIRFNTHDSIGRCFAEAIDIAPRSVGIEKVAGELHPKLKKFIASIKPDPKFQYVLMTPMGAFEYWGMNVNGDIFPEKALAHCYRDNNPEAVMRELEEKWLKPFGKRIPPIPIREFGFRTFESAKRYRNHVNKNPDISYGDIVFVIYNDHMHRVELIVKHDRERAKRVGAEEIIRDLDEGKSRQISMGCRVPFDACTVCGNISRNPRDYCEHLRREMGTVRPDGKIVGAVNLFPRFFDLSDVYVPAAKESGVLMKVAAKRGSFLEDIQKRAAYKRANITKKVLPNAVNDSMCRCAAGEKDIPKGILRMGGMGSLLSTLAMLGIIMKPKEFQYGMLNRM